MFPQVINEILSDMNYFSPPSLLWQQKKSYLYELFLCVSAASCSVLVLRSYYLHFTSSNITSCRRRNRVYLLYDVASPQHSWTELVRLCTDRAS